MPFYALFFKVNLFHRGFVCKLLSFIFHCPFCMDIAGCSNCAQILPVFVCLVLCTDFLTIMFSLFSAQCCLSSHSAAVHCLRFHSSVVVISYYRYSLSLLFNWHIFNVHPFDHDLQRTTGKSLGTLDVFTIFMWIAFVSYLSLIHI